MPHKRLLLNLSRHHSLRLKQRLHSLAQRLRHLLRHKALVCLIALHNSYANKKKRSY